MLTPLAFLQTGADAITFVEGRLDPVACPQHGSPAFFAPDFALSAGRPSWFDAAGQAARTMTRVQWAARFAGRGAPRVMPAWQDPDEGRFEAGFRSLRAQLDSGALRKGVPVTSMAAAMSDDEAVALFPGLLPCVAELPPGLLPYGFYLPHGGGTRGPEFLLGATPEVLFELEGCRSLSTVAVAGTRPADEGPAGLESSPKERDEHEAVVEDLLARLSGWGEATASRTEARQFGQLAHLVAEIRLEPHGPLDFEAVARRLHPTPALGVYPRGAAGDRWLAKIDPRGDRKRFGAPFGLRLPSGGGRCLVAIRNLQYSGGRLEIWAGCGVVAMSRYEDEWQEVLQKIQAVRTLWNV